MFIGRWKQINDLACLSLDLLVIQIVTEFSDKFTLFSSAEDLNF